MPKSVTKTDDSTIIFSIMNTSPNPKIVKRNVQVATLHPVKGVVSCDFSQPQNVNTDEDKNCLPDHLQGLANKASQKLTTTERQSLSDVIGQFLSDRTVLWDTPI